jgi:ribosomal protein S18 acetylase RimI-like enzyme
VLPFPLAFGKAKANLFAGELVFLIYVFDEGLEVGEGFFGHVVLFIYIKRYGANCSIGRGLKPNMRKTMKSDSATIRLEKEQVERASEVLARAFRNDPLAVYLFPDRAERESKLSCVLRSLLRYGYLYGGASATSPQLEGVVVWLPSEQDHWTLWRKIRSGSTLMLFRIGRRAAARWKALDAYLGAMKKRHVPSAHYYGLLLAVDPVYQGKGYGGALLRAVLAEVDRQRRPCYLETLTEKDVSFFQHFGFRVVEEGIVPGTELMVWGMMRKK